MLAERHHCWQGYQGCLHNSWQLGTLTGGEDSVCQHKMVGGGKDSEGSRNREEGSGIGGTRVPPDFIPLPFCCYYTSWICTSKIAGAGLRRPIRKAETFLKAMEQKSPYPEEPSATAPHPRIQHTLH